MDDGQQPQHKDGRYKMEYFKGLRAQWNIMPQHQMKEPSNALVMNWKTMAALAERDAAIRERNIALCEKKEALDARDQALEERDKAVAERDDALMARDSALAALQYHEAAANFSLSGGYQRGGKRMLQHHSTSHSGDVLEALNSGDIHATDATPITVILSETKSHQAKRTKEKKVVTKPSVSPRRVKKVGEDLNKKVASEGKKIKSERDSQDGLNLVNFDETTIPVPVCSCTGTPHQCYKWGNGGWQSSCCTTTLSSYPLPQIPNKRHARVGGRKMSGSVFTKLLSRLAAEGHDLSVPLDLKNFWARHGTNRYITIK